MADPYATDAPDLSGRPSGPPPWVAPVAERGGSIVGGEPRVAGGARFAVIGCRGIGTLAPLARLGPELGVLLWLEHTPAARSAASANSLLTALRGLEVPILAIKQGCVGGPPDRPGCFEVEAELIERVLDAMLAGKLEWEVDPDFGYEVPAEVPGLDPEAGRALLPRLLYADNDRVYEHAGLVAAKKRERWELARALPGLSAEIVAASGWPPTPTSDGWR